MDIVLTEPGGEHIAVILNWSLDFEDLKIPLEQHFDEDIEIIKTFDLEDWFGDQRTITVKLPEWEEEILVEKAFIYNI
jgi:hypothetical protein